ncbi:MAG: nucleotidyltransferase substrate binding protein [Acidobacteriota bacterium]|nr:nucleotidyltransferase substrate binding protein [Acidobacteriota bacterium]
MMDDAPLDIKALRDAVAALGRALRVYEHADNLDADVFETLRAGVIQSFEVAYEVAWKMMKRWLEINVSPTLFEGTTKKELFRHAAENHLIADTVPWFDFHRSRNITEHTYNLTNAKIAAELARKFFLEVTDFLTRLERRL